MTESEKKETLVTYATSMSSLYGSPLSLYTLPMTMTMTTEGKFNASFPLTKRLLLHCKALSTGIEHLEAVLKMEPVSQSDKKVAIVALVNTVTLMNNILLRGEKQKTSEEEEESEGEGEQ